MGIASKYNKQGNRFDYIIPEDSGHTFVKASDLFENFAENEKGVVVRSMYLNNKGKYGAHGVLVCDTPAILIDCPNHMTETIKDIMNDDDAVAQINAGKLAVKAYKYDTKNAACGFAYGLEFIDVD